MEVKRLGYFIVQSSFSGDPKGNDWINVLPEDVPEWVKEPEVIGRLKSGEMACDEGERNVSWFRAIRMNVTPDMARRLVKKYFADNEDKLKENSSPLGAVRLAQDVMRILKQVFVYRLGTGKDPEPDSELAFMTRILLSELLEQAETDPVSYDALLEISAELQGFREFLPSLPLPSQLSQWLNQEHTRPRQHGPSRYKYWVRNLHIAWAIHLLEMNGMLPTRNDARSAEESPSACDIVVEVLKDFGIHLSFNSVRTIWDDYGNLK